MITHFQLATTYFFGYGLTCSDSLPFSVVAQYEPSLWIYDSTQVHQRPYRIVKIPFNLCTAEAARGTAMHRNLDWVRMIRPTATYLNLTCSMLRT